MNTTAKQIVIAKGMAVATALMLALTGCSQQANPTPSQKVYSFAPTGKSGLAAFAKIAKASCDKANAEGTVQRTTDNAVFVMIPKDKAIKGFSAAYVSAKKKYDIIYENDSFFACALANQIELYAESGLDVTTPKGQKEFEQYTKVETDAQPNTYDVTGEYGNDQYTVENGLITYVTSQIPTDKKRITGYELTYGYTSTDLNVIKNAVKTLN
jgi:hypothetical protein